MKYVFYVDLRHLPYQTFTNTLFHFMIHNNLVFQRKYTILTNCNILHQIRVKFEEYDFKLQRFIILYQKQKFHRSPKIADFFQKYYISPPKVLKPIDFRFDIMSLINPCIKIPNFQ